MTNSVLKIMRDRFQAHVVYAKMQAPPFHSCTLTVLPKGSVEQTYVKWDHDEVVVIPEPGQILHNGASVTYEIIDFQEVVDNRIGALRHYDTSKPHMFVVHVSSVLKELAQSLSESHGYSMDLSAIDRKLGCYHVEKSIYYGVRWYVDKVSLHEYDELKELTVKNEFIGTYDECEEMIRKLELATRQAFENFLTHDSYPLGLTPVYVSDMLNTLRHHLVGMDPKVRDKKLHQRIVDLIGTYKHNVAEIGRKQLESLAKDEN